MIGYPQHVIELQEDPDELVFEIPRVAIDLNDLLFMEDPDM